MTAIPDIKKLVDTLEGDEKTGAVIVMRALEEPMRQIAANAGIDGGVVINNIINHSGKDIGYGYDALKNEYCDVASRGIIDPTKVTRSALQNAASVAAILLTTESVVADIPEKQPAAPAADPSMGGMGGMY